LRHAVGPFEPPRESAMSDVLFNLYGLTITPWKLVGLLGTFLFTARWFVQFYATKKSRRVVMPMSFWYLSIVGSVMTLAYFIWGKNDSVGILQNAFPMFVSVYNVYVHVRHHEPEVVSPGGSEET
jgi:lipid-A-disaccharide synthase-like uncharacterized protein